MTEPEESAEYLRGRRSVFDEFIKYGLVNYSSYDDLYWFKDQHGLEHDIKLPKPENDDTV